MLAMGDAVDVEVQDETVSLSLGFNYSDKVPSVIGALTRPGKRLDQKTELACPTHRTDTKHF